MGLKGRTLAYVSGSSGAKSRHHRPVALASCHAFACQVSFGSIQFRALPLSILDFFYSIFLCLYLGLGLYLYRLDSLAFGSVRLLSVPFATVRLLFEAFATVR